jgi:hypothetical protein
VCFRKSHDEMFLIGEIKKVFRTKIGEWKTKKW